MDRDADGVLPTNGSVVCAARGERHHATLAAAIELRFGEQHVLEREQPGGSGYRADLKGERHRSPKLEPIEMHAAFPQEARIKLWSAVDALRSTDRPCRRDAHDHARSEAEDSSKSRCRILVS